MALSFGLLGTGYWALHTHGTALAASPHAELRGVWGRDPAKARDLGKRLGAEGYEDLDELLGEVDAVAIALPPDIQAELAVRAARAGCHLLLEKPLALSVEAAQAVVRAVDEAGVASVVFFTSRFRPDVEDWTGSAAEAGAWYSAHLVHYANIYQPGSPYAGSAWRRERGALWDIGPHGLAALLPVMGPVTSVAARSGPAGSDTVHLVLTHGPRLAGTGVQAAGAEAEPVGAAQGAAEEIENLSWADVPAGSPAAGAPVPADPPRPRSAQRTAMPYDLGNSPGGPAAVSVLSLGLTMPPPATASQLVLYGERGARARPEGSFEPAEAFQNAIAELAAMAETGTRRHRCDARFGLDVVRALAAAEEALALPGIALRH
ncbi:MAG: Gfo/Idh/MocA family protein [Acidimicrobiales bacterium]